MIKKLTIDEIVFKSCKFISLLGLLYDNIVFWRTHARKYSDDTRTIEINDCVRYYVFLLDIRENRYIFTHLCGSQAPISIVCVLIQGEWSSFAMVFNGEPEDFRM